MDVGNSSSSKMDKYWVDSPNQCHYDRNLNFAAIGSEDEEAYSNFSKKTKSARDPQSHRIIEKRRRDRMNNCLADLSRLLPSAYMKKGRGRIEKTEIIEMTIKHMKHLQVHACKEMESCDIAVQMEQLHSNTKSDQYRSGFLECITETVQFIGHHQADHHGPFYPGDDFGSRLVAHLHNHYEKISRGEGTSSETGEYSNGITAVTSGTRTGHTNGAGPPVADGEDFVIKSPSVCSTAPQGVQDQFKTSNDNTAESDKMKDDRVQGMFTYMNSGSTSTENHRQQHQQQHSNDNRPTRTSSGSGGDSDESRSNRATRNSDTPSPVNPTTDGSSPTDMDNSSHSGGSNHSSSRSGTSSSQLRQMLLSNSESSRTKSCSSSSQCSSRSNTTQHSSTDDSNSVYKKFKTNIHQRFTADLEHVFPQSSCVMTPSSGSSSSNSLPEQQTQQPSHHSLIERNFEQFHGLKRKKSDGDIHRHANSRYGWNGDIPPPPPPSSPTTRGQRLHSGEIDDPYTIDHTAMQQEQQQSANLQIIQPAENVPIFALHPKGAFYVPMSVELSLVRALFNPPSSSNNAQPLLHPVTISVNFGHPSRVLTAATVADTVLAVQQHSSVIQSPAKITKPESTLLPGLVPVPQIVHHQRHPNPHHQQFDMDPFGTNFSPLPLGDDSSLRVSSREHGSRSSLPRHHDEQPKMFRPPQREESSGYAHGSESRTTREYPIIRSSREHGSRSPAVITANHGTATHSSRWSHLMAKRTHTP